MWPDRRIIDLFKTEFPILLAPMAGVMDADLAIAVAQGGGVPSLPCAMISPEKTREQVKIIRQRVSAPVNLNFFCHEAVEADPARETIWRQRLTTYYREHGLDPAAQINAANRAPFDECNPRTPYDPRHRAAGSVFVQPCLHRSGHLHRGTLAA